MILNSELNFTENIKYSININNSSISPHNNELINWIYYSRIKTLRWALDQYENHNLKVLKKIILAKINVLKKEMKKTVYRIDIIRISSEIDNLEFCLNAVVQDINRANSNDKILK